MKRLDDYTSEELNALTEQEIAVLTAVEMMAEGVQEEAQPGPQPIFGESLQATTLYTLSSNALYATAEDAQKAADLAVGVSTYESLKSTYAYDKEERPTVHAKPHYDLDDFRAVKAQRTTFERESNDWERRNRAWSEYCRSRSKVEETVWDRLREARSEVGEAEAREKEFLKFVELAGGAEVAGRFFLNMLNKQGWDEGSAAEELQRVVVKYE